MPTSSLTPCPDCGHVHDPEDGRCDAHADVGLGRCRCARGVLPASPRAAEGAEAAPASTLADVFARLETWSHGHKARSVCIESPDGYGAGCWMVTLGHEHGITHAAECAFFTFPEDKGGDVEYRRQAEVAGQVYVAGEDMDDWPGLAATVACALDAFDRGVWGPRKAPEASALAEARARIAELEERVRALAERIDAEAAEWDSEAEAQAEGDWEAADTARTRANECRRIADRVVRGLSRDEHERRVRELEAHGCYPMPRTDGGAAVKS